jgi:hypothetical protein
MALILWRQTEVKDAIEMPDHLIIGVVPPIVKVGWVEIGVQQGRRLLKPAGADIVLAMIDKSRRRHMATGAAERGILRKRLAEQRLAAACGSARLRRQPPSRAETWVRQKIDVLDIDDNSIEQGRGGLRARKLGDDDIADEVTL